LAKAAATPPSAITGVSFAQKRFADDANGHSAGGRFDCRAQSGTAGADDQDIVFVGLVVGH
jgi:hypothetical protein